MYAMGFSMAWHPDCTLLMTVRRRRWVRSQSRELPALGRNMHRLRMALLPTGEPA